METSRGFLRKRAVSGFRSGTRVSCPGSGMLFHRKVMPLFPGSQWSGRGKGSLFSGFAVMQGPDEGLQCLWAYVEYGPDGGLESTALVCFSTRSDAPDGNWKWGEPDDARCVRVLKNGNVCLSRLGRV